MPCYHPLTAFQTEGGEIVFAERGKIQRTVILPCGQCIGCRLKRSRHWAIRCMHEASMQDNNEFITLTYNNNSIETNSLNYLHFQHFMKRARRRYSPARVRFYMCGEYGEQFKRPHFHACLFNIKFEDRKYFAKSPSGEKVYTSKILEQLWPHGYALTANVTFQSAAYVARYCTKKITGRMAKAHYEQVDADGVITQRVPEFNHMSLKPGIGASWLSRFTTDAYPHGKVVVNGKRQNTPRYYDKLFKKIDPDGYELLEYGRYLESLTQAEHQTDARLRVQEQVATARLNLNKRSIA